MSRDDPWTVTIRKRQTVTVEATCQFCGMSFPYERYSETGPPQRYCSQSCRAKGQEHPERHVVPPPSGPLTKAAAIAAHDTLLRRRRRARHSA